MTSFDWLQPQWWLSAEPHSVPETIEILGLVYSLRAARPETLFHFLRGWKVSEMDLPPRVLGAYPLQSADVETFLNAAGALVPPETAAVRMTERLIAVDSRMNEVVLAQNVLDVWRHGHDLIAGNSRHGDHCSCLMDCELMPRGIRTLDTVLQTYYEEHHDQPVPDCFGASDESFRRSLRPLIQCCLEGVAKPANPFPAP